MLVVAVLIAACAVQIVYWIALSRGFAKARSERHGHDLLEPISVVVAARNEEYDLAALLKALSQQTHPKFEVIVVDDGSTDRTAEIARSMAGVRLIATDGAGKKKALAAGIAAASNELLAFTDADCVPPPGWLSSLAAAHAPGEECLVVGYSPFISKEGGLPADLACYETFVTGFLTAAAVGAGRPYMAVGRNMSYSRSLFRKVGGFAAIEHSLSGDDDLFLQHVVRMKAARVIALLDPSSFVATEAPGRWREWIRQKRRHASGGRFYSASIQAHLAAFHLSGILTWLSPLLLGWIGLGLLAIKLAVQAVVLRRAAAVLGAAEQLRFHLEPLYVLYNMLLVPVGLTKMPEKW